MLFETKDVVMIPNYYTTTNVNIILDCLKSGDVRRVEVLQGCDMGFETSSGQIESKLFEHMRQISDTTTVKVLVALDKKLDLQIGDDGTDHWPVNLLTLYLWSICSCFDSELPYELYFIFDTLMGFKESSKVIVSGIGKTTTSKFKFSELDAIFEKTNNEIRLEFTSLNLEQGIKEFLKQRKIYVLYNLVSLSGRIIKTIFGLVKKISIYGQGFEITVLRALNKNKKHNLSVQGIISEIYNSRFLIPSQFEKKVKQIEKCFEYIEMNCKDILRFGRLIKWPGRITGEEGQNIQLNDVESLYLDRDIIFESLDFRPVGKERKNQWLEILISSMFIIGSLQYATFDLEDISIVKNSLLITLVISVLLLNFVLCKNEDRIMTQLVEDLELNWCLQVAASYKMIDNLLHLIKHKYSLRTNEGFNNIKNVYDMIELNE